LRCEPNIFIPEFENRNPKTPNLRLSQSQRAPAAKPELEAEVEPEAEAPQQAPQQAPLQATLNPKP